MQPMNNDTENNITVFYQILTLFNKAKQLEVCKEMFANSEARSILCHIHAEITCEHRLLIGKNVKDAHHLYKPVIKYSTTQATGHE
jgi:hypothetical protein